MPMETYLLEYGGQLIVICSQSLGRCCRIAVTPESVEASRASSLRPRRPAACAEKNQRLMEDGTGSPADDVEVVSPGVANKAPRQMIVCRNCRYASP